MAMAAPASQPSSQPTVKVEGRVEIVKDEVKVTQEKDIDVIQMVKDLYVAFKEGRVWNGVSILLMLLTFLFGKVKKDIPVKYLPWIAASLGIATNIVSAVLGGVDVESAIANGFLHGAAAAGFWSMIGKHIFRSKDEKMKRERAREIVNGGTTSGEMES
jgi:hypothetical protein